MLTDPIEITLKAPHNNAHYWKSFVSMLKRRKEYHLKHGLTISRRRLQLKRLLSRELNLCQISLEMGLPMRLIEEFIWYLGWTDFVQPGKHKEANRETWKARQTLMATEDQYEVLEKAIIWGVRRLRDARYLDASKSEEALIKDWIEDEARLHFIRCLRNWRPDGTACFGTYFNNLWHLKLKDVMKKIGKEYDLRRTIHRLEKTETKSAA